MSGLCYLAHLLSACAVTCAETFVYCCELRVEVARANWHIFCLSASCACITKHADPCASLTRLALHRHVEVVVSYVLIEVWLAGRPWRAFLFSFLALVSYVRPLALSFFDLAIKGHVNSVLWGMGCYGVSSWSWPRRVWFILNRCT